MLVLLHLKLISNPRLINIALDYRPFEFINPDGQRSLAANDPKFSLRKAATREAGKNLPRILQSVLTPHPIPSAINSNTSIMAGFSFTSIPLHFVLIEV